MVIKRHVGATAVCVLFNAHFTGISGGYVATLVDELKNVLSGGPETTARVVDEAIGQNNSRAK